MGMWDATDVEMREAVLRRLRSDMQQMVFQAEREERALAERTVPAGDRRESEACARYSRQQAAHYQQALNLLTAAPMPPKDEPR